VVLRNQQYFEIANLELSNDDDFDTDITSAATPVVRDGVAISINADLFDEDDDDRIMNYFRISDLHVHNIDGPSTWQQIHYGGINFQVFGAEQFREYEEGMYYFQDVRIENNTFDKVELHAIQFAFNWFFDRDAGSGQFDDDGKWHEGWEQLWVRTRDLYSRDVYIGHNYAEDTGQGAIQLANTKDMVVEYNEVNKYLQRYNAVSVALYLWAGADSVMQFNEVYGGPWHEFDGTPWDLEYTNFDVAYQYNYSHDNAAGWMSYMGNSSNSIARYNLSVNDNGVLVKNMLSTNYSPTYFTNNVFIYDAEHMDWFHDERFLSTVYFLNNVFYNTSETRTTPWFRWANALDNAVFSNNAFYEASGNYSDQQPDDPNAVIGDPMFANDVEDYKADNGVLNIRDSASVFTLDRESPLIDAGRYNPSLGAADFFGTPVYFGDAPDIGIHADVFLDKLEFCHTIGWNGRLEMDAHTIPLAELVLEKMQIVEINEKDIIDTIMLLLEYPLDEHDREAINIAHIASLCARDWGLWRTTTMNLDKVQRLAEGYPQLGEGEKRAVRGKVDDALSRIEGEPKGRKWRLRAVIGDRKKWYRDVGELGPMPGGL
jgi:hypothetical protein